MKNLKYCLIFISLFIALAPSLGAMDVNYDAKVSSSDETKSSFTLEAINNRLANIKINGDFLQLQQYDTSSEKRVALKTNATEIGFIRYSIDKNITHIWEIKVTKQYRKLGLASLLTIAALHKDLTNDAWLLATHPAIKKIFSTLGFHEGNMPTSYQTDKLRTLLQNNGNIILENAFKKLESLAYRQMPCHKKALICFCSTISCCVRCCQKKKN